jgi:hypothetical protein
MHYDGSIQTATVSGGFALRHIPLVGATPFQPDDTRVSPLPHHDASTARSFWTVILMPSLHIAATPSVSSYPLDDELVLYTPSDGQAYILNRTAARLWRLLDGTRTEIVLARELADTYGEEYEQVLVDVHELVKHLHAVGLLTLQPNGAEPQDA